MLEDAGDYTRRVGEGGYEVVCSCCAGRLVVG